MNSYIQGTGVISPQKTAENNDFLAEVVEYIQEFLTCIDPNYRSYIDPIVSRRMSHMIKMGVASARICLADAGCSMPDGIITGTGMGSVEDTEKILGAFSEDSPLTNPTPFIQSTYNTISSQIAITLKCTNYNSTYVHRTFSFETGLQDALMLIAENPASRILVGGIDEMTQNHLTVIRRLGHWRMHPTSNLRLLDYSEPGALAGQGSSFFLLSGDPGEKRYCKLLDVATYYKPQGADEIVSHFNNFLAGSGMKINDVDLLITGVNGDRKNDELYYQLGKKVFKGTPLAWYKHLCGEYSTSTGFALWLAANILKRQEVPQVVLLDGNKPSKLKNILIYNHFRQINHSLILLSAL
jgi:3-oxoacyl-[acyl-carrier-protein] synthase II